MVDQWITPRCEFAYLLGSAGTPRFHAESDYDFAVFPKEGTSLLALHQSLEEALERNVDLVSLNPIDLIFARQVLETGRLISNSNNSLRVCWIAHQLSLYPDFKYSRKIIEDNLLTRKKYV